MSTLKIVVVDDDPVTGRVVVRWLQTHAHHAFLCTDSSEAENTIRIYRPDVVLLDVLMPGISGPDLALLLRRNPETKTSQSFSSREWQFKSWRRWQLGPERSGGSRRPTASWRF